MSRTLHGYRTALLNLALHSPSITSGGVEQVGSHFLFHLPTLWAYAKGFLAPALHLDPTCSWQDAASTLLMALPGRPVHDAKLLESHSLPPEEVAVCEVPFDGAYIGLTPDEWTSRAAIEARSHWFAQLLYAVQDLAAPSGPAKTGVWRDGTSGRIVINWALRAAYRPGTITSSGLENPLTVPHAVRANVETKPVVRQTTKHMFDNSLRRSPWPDAHVACTVISVEALADHCEFLESRSPPKPVSRYVWSKAFDPQLQLVDDMPDVNLHYFRDWARKNNIRAFPYEAIWLRQRWAIALPVGVFSNRWGDEAARDADRSARDLYIKRYADGKRYMTVDQYLRDHVIFYKGKEYYTETALTAFVVHPDHYYVFEFLQAFLRYASKPENQSIIADKDARSQRKRRATSGVTYTKGRTPNWTPEEDSELRLYFSPKTTDTDDTERRRLADQEVWEWLLGERSKIKPYHRTREQILGRIWTLNLQLRKDCMTRGVMTPSGWRRYCMNRLGQRERRT